MDVSIIIINYNTVNVLCSAIKSLLDRSKNFEFEIIVVDNDSSDNAKFILEEMFGQKVNYIQLLSNVGFGSANNIGLGVAKGENILFLNPDIQLLNNAIKILLDFLRKYDNVGVVGGNLYTLDHKPGYSYTRILPGMVTEVLSLMTFGFLSKVIPNLYHNHSNKPIKVASISGANLMIRRSVLEKVGCFDPVFFMYYEDTELNWRVRKAKYKLMNVPSAKFSHIDSCSFNLKENKIKMSLQSRAIFLEKTRGKFYRKTTDKMYLLVVNFQLFVHFIFRKDRNYYVTLKKITQAVYFNKKYPNEGERHEKLL